MAIQTPVRDLPRADKSLHNVAVTPGGSGQVATYLPPIGQQSQNQEGGSSGGQGGSSQDNNPSPKGQVAAKNASYRVTPNQVGAPQDGPLTTLKPQVPGTFKVGSMIPVGFSAGTPYAGPGKFSSRTGKPIVVHGETPSEWASQINHGRTLAQIQTTNLSGYLVATDYYNQLA